MGASSDRRLKILILGLSSLFILSGCGSNSGNGTNEASSVHDPTGFKLTCEEARFVVLLNLYRQSNGLATLKVSQGATRSSRFHGLDMIEKNYFSHTEPNGRTFNVRASAFGYSAWAENIAAGNALASNTFCQWKNSAGHNANMLGSHQTTGIGRATGGGYGYYWSSNFGPSAPDVINEPLTIESPCSMPTALPSC